MSEPTTAELLSQVLQRLDSLESRLDAIHGTTVELEKLGAKAPVFIEMAAQSATWAYGQAEANGIDPIEAGVAATGIAIEAGKPESMAAVARLLAKTATLHKTLDVVDKLEADGTLDTLVDHGADVAPRLAKLMQTEGFKKLVDQTLNDANAIEVASSATTAMIEVRSKPIKPLGLFGQLGMLRDADVQKAIGFSLAIAKRFGQLL